MLDSRGPWNEGGDWEIVETHQLEQGVENLEGSNGEGETTAKRKTAVWTLQPPKR